MKRTWALLRNLIDPSKNKTESAKKITKLIQDFEGTEAQMHEELIKLYVTKNDGGRSPSLRYTGPDNETLDVDFTFEEVHAAIRTLRRTTSPGEDKISNKLLRHLDETAIETLTAYFNKVWCEGEVPPDWKHANITLIPKPGKAIKMENLRPISLTSCVGKLMEHVVNARIMEYLETNDMLPHNQIGFRPRLSTQDALIQIKHDLLDNPPKKDNAAILAIDLHKAFDNVSHEAILTEISTLGLGARTFAYVKSFLTGRTARMKLGSSQTETFKMPDKGTPQGAVLSPLLFNLAIRPMANALCNVPMLRATIYADDITLWVGRGSDAHIEHTLRKGAEIVAEFATKAGLTYSTTKSELMILHPPKTKPATQQPIEVSIAGQNVPTVSQLKILGLRIQANRGTAETVRVLRSHTMQTIGMLRRINSRQHGLTEEERLRLVQAFVVSRFSYHLPYVNLTQSNKDSLDALLRRAHRTALHIPNSASTTRLANLGIHNTVDEIIDAQRTAQIHRLAQTTTGRSILQRVQIQPPNADPTPVRIPRNIRALIKIQPIPRNMHPTFHAGRREARAQYHSRHYPPDEHTVYVDAAQYPDKAAFAIACIASASETEPRIKASIRTANPTTAEETALALAITKTPTPTIVLSDSQQALRNYEKGSISAPALNILLRRPPDQPVMLVWTPAHTGVGTNEVANQQARALIPRASTSLGSTHGTLEFARYALTTYRDITQHYRLTRRTLPPPNAKLTIEEAQMWRTLQTHSFPHRTQLQHSHPHLFPSAECPRCHDLDTLYHSLCGPLPPLPHWEQALGSSCLEDQRTLAQRALQVASAIWAEATPPT